MPIQTTLMDFFSIHGIKPDLVLVVVFLIGLKMGEMNGLLMGLIMGFMMDLFSGGIVGINLLTKPFVGWVSGIPGRVMLTTHIFFSTTVLFGLSLAMGLVTYLYLQIFGETMNFWSTFRLIIFPQALYDMVLGAFLIALTTKRRKIFFRA